MLSTYPVTGSLDGPPPARLRRAPPPYPCSPFGLRVDGGGSVVSALPRRSSRELHVGQNRRVSGRITDRALAHRWSLGLPRAPARPLSDHQRQGPPLTIVGEPSCANLQRDETTYRRPTAMPARPEPPPRTNPAAAPAVAPTPPPIAAPIGPYPVGSIRLTGSFSAYP